MSKKSPILIKCLLTSNELCALVVLRTCLLNATMLTTQLNVRSFVSQNASTEKIRIAR